MTPIAIVLVLISAVTHATWNFLGKRQNPSAAFFMVAQTATVICLTPLLVLYRGAIAQIPLVVWSLLAITGVCQATYFIGLAGAYRRADMSLVYPMMRAIPVLLVAAISLALGRGDEIGRLGLLGMLLVVAGCLVLPLPGWREIRLGHYLHTSLLLALMAAVGTTGYTLVDDTALRHLRQTPGTGASSVELTLLFAAFETASTVLVLAVYTLLQRREYHNLRHILRTQKRPAIFTGINIFLTYSLVLIAMGYVSNVSYVAAFRQLSIPLGAAMGIVLQNEARPTPRLAGIAVVSIGLVLVGIG